MRTLSRPSHRGFTLIEILIAVTISTLVLGATYSLFRGTVKAWAVIRYDVQCMKTARKVFAIMEQDLRNAMSETGENPAQLTFSCTHAASTGGVTLIFAAAQTPQQTGTSDWKSLRVTYEFYFDIISRSDSAHHDKAIERKTVNILSAADHKEQVLAKKTDFSTIKVRVLKWNGTQFELLDNWNTSEIGFPKAVEITLVFAGKNGYQPKWTRTITIPYAMGA